MEKNYRIHTNISSDTVLNVNMQQDYDFLEVLSLKLRQKDAYRLHSSNYGVIIGRVLANDAFGIPNAKVSVFIERDANDPTYIETVYPYTEVMSTDREGRRYNLLPDYSNDDCYRIVGTFPNKRFVLDDDITLEVYDKYWKFTTVTNNSGDYMLFGVPSGSQQIHIDMDLSDIGILSQKPRDFEYKGYNLTLFDNPNQFKESTNLDGLAQIISQNKSTFVYPFWGDADNGIAAITRCDVQVDYKFEPTCVFMGAIISDNEGNSIGHKCAPAEDNGMNSQLIAGEGTIEMIRKTTDGLVEEFQIQGNQLIDSNGVWCYQIPMNLDFIGMDEYGNIIPTDNPNKGIPTRTQVRFRFSKNETGDEGHSRHTAKYLVPFNPTLVGSRPMSLESGKNVENMYIFGSATPQSCFRDLYWNNVYSVKNYIPKTQVAHRPYAPNYTGLKGSNLVDDQNPVPFNKLRIDIPFVYIIVCILFNLVGVIVSFINFMINILNAVLNIFDSVRNFCVLGICPFGWLPALCCIGCLSLGGGLSPDNTAFYPGCDHRGMDASDCPDDMENCKKRASLSVLMDLVQQKLASDYKIVKLDFYQDWLNGSLYMPLWYWRKRKKRTFLFGLFSSSAKNEYCDCNKTYSRLKTYVTCNFNYANKKLGVNDGVVTENEDNWHRSKSRAGHVGFSNGLIKQVENKDGLNVYYYVGIQPTNDGEYVPMERKSARFPAIRLFATDIILLGNLNENNLYGIPQFFKALPSTTANIPPIATVREADDTDISTSNNELADNGETGPSLTTGMDWGYDGEDNSPNYKEGLFMDLTCTYADTKAKSCINVERLSELGMNLDMIYDTTYRSSSKLMVGTFDSDGFITKLELDDTENRAMFATMNHIGFMPQAYQDSINGKVTQVYDKNTNYLVPKFKYIYPVDLDGRMQPITERYKNGFQQKLDDITDESYINFRLGDVEFSRNGDGQFYKGNSMPLYNNSFYFYFGVKKGNTAIEKFNKMFYSQCFKNNKMPFTLNIDTKGASYCPDVYTYSGDAYGYIEISSDDIQLPYSYELVDTNGNEVASSGKIEDSTVKIDTDYRDETPEPLMNGTYNLTVTDANGKKISERVTLSMDNITIVGETRPLGIKYYDEQSSSGSVCSNDNWGEIKFTSLYIDSYEFTITSASIVANVHDIDETHTGYTYIVQIKGENENFNSITPIALLGFKESNGDETCLCSGNTTSEFFGFFCEEENGKIVFGFRIYQPSTYVIDLFQNCGGIYSANTNSQAFIIQNGENFHAYLNKMPIDFMGNFYDSETTDNVDINNWLKIHDSSIYNFFEFKHGASETTLLKWQDFLGLDGNGFDSLSNKKKVLNYKFNRIFDVCKAAYVTNGGNNKFTYTAMGGIQPTLYRSLAPYYSDSNKVLTNYKYSDNNGVSFDRLHPNIVGDNYNDGGTDSPRLNNLFDDGYGEKKKHLGNYFAAFTNNGGYTGLYDGDCCEYVVAAPLNASVNLESSWKKLGSDEDIEYIPPLVYKRGNGGTCTSSTEICPSGTHNPYFKAMFVDRQLDYDLVALAPVLNIPDELVNTWDGAKIRKTTYTRLFGTIYNGVEMAYDENLNVISANIDGRISAESSKTEGYYIQVTDAAKIDTSKVVEVYGDYVGINGVEDNAILHFNNIPISGTSNNDYYVPPILDDEGNIFIDENGKYHWKDKDGNDNLATELWKMLENDMWEYATSANPTDYEDYLEYTYSYPKSGGSEDTNVILCPIVNEYSWVNYDNNVSSQMCKIVAGHDVPTNGLTSDKPRMKEFLSANLLNIDIRHLLWSKYSKDMLTQVLGNTAFTDWNSDDIPFVLFDHSGGEGTEYNGYWEENYPTKRYIDLGKLKPYRNLYLNITSCGYDMSLETNNSGKIISTLNENDNLEVNIVFENAFIPKPRVVGEKYDWGHFIYHKGINTEGDTVGIEGIGFIGKYKANTDDNLVCVSMPRFIKLSQIETLKTATTYADIELIFRGDGTTENPGLPQFPLLETASEDSVPNRYGIDEDLFITYDGKRINLDEDKGEFAQPSCTCRILEFGHLNLIWSGFIGHWCDTCDGNEFSMQDYFIRRDNGDGYKGFELNDYIENGYTAIIVRKEMRPKTDANHSSRIICYEISDFYDCRSIDTTHNCNKTSDKVTAEITIYKTSANKAIVEDNIKSISMNILGLTSDDDDAQTFEIPIPRGGESSQVGWYTDNSGNIIIKGARPWEGDAHNSYILLYVTVKNGAIYRLVYDYDF